MDQDPSGAKADSISSGSGTLLLPRSPNSDVSWSSSEETPNDVHDVFGPNGTREASDGPFHDPSAGSLRTKRVPRGGSQAVGAWERRLFLRIPRRKRRFLETE